jgi:hypothetical protein
MPRGGAPPVLDLADAAATLKRPADGFSSMPALIEAGPSAWDEARRLIDARPGTAVVDIQGRRLLAPLPDPPWIRDYLSFEEHLVNSLASQRDLVCAPT